MIVVRVSLTLSLSLIGLVRRHLASAVFVCVCVIDLRSECQHCDGECEVVEGFNMITQQTVRTAYCVCDVGYRRVRVIDGFSCSCQYHFLSV